MADVGAKKPSGSAAGAGRASEKLWGGRFDSPTDAGVERFTASIHFDRALARFDLRGSAAHARMLASVGLISADDERALREGLAEIGAQIDAGRFPFDAALEDIHMNIESRLREIVGGETAGRLHTGRSRNDQVATDLALYLREVSTAAERGILELRSILVERAAEHIDTVLPGYTHLQKAQPIRYAHYLLAYYEMLDRDRQRFLDGFQRVNVMPLGSGALAGTNYPINREELAEDLGFPAVTENSLDAVSDRDGAIEFLSAAGLLMMHLSRFSEEMVLWSTDEFGLIDLPDDFCTGSSLMPQKKNPDVPELIRAKTGRVYGHLVALLTVMKGLPLAYNRDLQEDKEAVFDTADTIRDVLTVLTELVHGIEVHREAAERAARTGFLLATDLADYLVDKGLPFRQAHEIVGRIVRDFLDHHKDFAQIALKDLQKFSDRFQKDVLDYLDLEASLERKKSTGSTARKRILERIRQIESQ